MPSLPLLPPEILSLIIDSAVCKRDVASWALSCRSLHSYASKRLYSGCRLPPQVLIRILQYVALGDQAERGRSWCCEDELCRWSLVSQHARVQAQSLLLDDIRFSGSHEQFMTRLPNGRQEMRHRSHHLLELLVFLQQAIQAAAAERWMPVRCLHLGERYKLEVRRPNEPRAWHRRFQFRRSHCVELRRRMYGYFGGTPSGLAAIYGPHNGLATQPVVTAEQLQFRQHLKVLADWPDDIWDDGRPRWVERPFRPLMLMALTMIILPSLEHLWLDLERLPTDEQLNRFARFSQETGWMESHPPFVRQRLTIYIRLGWPTRDSSYPPEAVESHLQTQACMARLIFMLGMIPMIKKVHMDHFGTSASAAEAPAQANVSTAQSHRTEETAVSHTTSPIAVSSSNPLSLADLRLDKEIFPSHLTTVSIAECQTDVLTLLALKRLLPHLRSLEVSLSRADVSLPRIQALAPIWQGLESLHLTHSELPDVEEKLGEAMSAVAGLHRKSVAEEEPKTMTVLQNQHSFSGPTPNDSARNAVGRLKEEVHPERSLCSGAFIRADHLQKLTVPFSLLTGLTARTYDLASQLPPTLQYLIISDCPLFHDCRIRAHDTHLHAAHLLVAIDILANFLNAPHFRIKLPQLRDLEIQGLTQAGSKMGPWDRYRMDGHGVDALERGVGRVCLRLEIRYRGPRVE